MADSSVAVGIIPKPADVQWGEGSFRITRETVVLVTPGAGPEASLLVSQLAPAMGFRLAKEERAVLPDPRGSVAFRLDPVAQDLAEEGYRLTVSADGVEISAYRPAGLFYGSQTLRHLLPPEAMSPSRVTGVVWTVPAVAITDRPRFGWRGHLFDTSRHFFTVDEIKRAIDLIALHKLNVFHWHLLDDQGWRLESKRYPRLTEIGAWRRTADGGTHGGYYTQDDVREILAFAAARHVTVVPEIEMPGHSVAALASYSYLGCTGGPYEVRPDRGITKQVYCAGQEETYQFVFNLLDEVLDLFPSQFIHIGGDECPKDEWSACPKCQDRIKREGLADEKELQSYFIHRVDEYLTQRGRRLVGWDEIVEGGLAPGAVVQAWRDVQHAKAAALSGHDVILSPTSHCYLDYSYEKISTQQAYSYEALLEDNAVWQEERILGLEGNTWSEEVPDQERYDYQTYPRLSALAEVAWSQPDRREWTDFSARLDQLKRRFQILGVQYGGTEAEVSEGVAVQTP